MTPFVSPQIPTADYSRLERTIFNNQQVRSLSTLVVGGGALGNEVVRIPGLLGVARVLIVDPDIVEVSNLPRSFFFWSGDAVGRAKVSGLVEALTNHFPATHWEGLQCEIADVGLARIAKADILFSCVDNDLARLEIAYISTKLDIAVADGGLGTKNYSHGRMSYFPGAKGACYGCLLSPQKRRELLQSWQATLRPCTGGEASVDEVLSSTPTMASVVAAMQVELGLRYLFEDRSQTTVESRSLEVRLHPTASMTEYRTRVSESCPFHECTEGELIESSDPQATIEEVLNQAAADFLVLDWPICTKAECLSCHHQWLPMQRLAAIRRRGHCPACGSGNLLELETVRTIGRDSRFLRLRPQALGLPIDHLFTLRKGSIRQ